MSDSNIYSQLAQQLKSAEIAVTPAELDGFLAGLLAGGNKDDSWQPLLFDMVNNGQAISQPLLKNITELYSNSKQHLEEDEFEFQLLLNSDSLFAAIDDLVGWVNHFLLGLGLAQPQLSKVKGEVGEAIADLRQIAKLGYDEDDDPEELAQAFEEVMEFVRIAAMLCHDEFAQQAQPTQTLQ